ncbi:hypothetical protein BM1_08793 [Bipolaris maydis]|nr:hypothetical protein BM1_08793 [Bipolaris maydis]
MKYFVILLAAVATASAVAVPEAQPESLDKRACYTALAELFVQTLLVPEVVPTRRQSSAVKYGAELLLVWLAKDFGTNVGSAHQSF